jgi:parallel beta-helix repeat protein
MSATSTGINIEKVSKISYDGITLHVGGSGPGNYSKIQDAIDDSSDWDTIFVYDDSSPYYETLIINKSISLFGENKETTIIDGNGNNAIILIILTDYVNIEGFTICNSSRSEFDCESVSGVGIKLLAATFCNISDNIITNTNVGIYLLNYIWQEFTYGNTVLRNIFLKNSCGIAFDWGSGYNTVENNLFRLNWHGIIVITTNSNTISKNNFLWNLQSVLLRPDVFWPDGRPLDEIDHNTWSMNYWGRPKLLHIIFGRARVVYDHSSWYVRYIELDFKPAKEPYDI